jgi:flagellar motor component MotA
MDELRSGGPAMNEVHGVPKQSEHMSVARDMGKAIVSNFNPDQQNEMLRHIRDIVRTSREESIVKVEKELCYLKQTFQDM